MVALVEKNIWTRLNLFQKHHSNQFINRIQNGLGRLIERHAANCASATQSGEMFIPPASMGENVTFLR